MIASNQVGRHDAPGGKDRSEPGSGEVFLLETTSDAATASLCSHLGAVRTENQDRVGHAIGPAGEVFLVADGVGGHSGGGEAAQLAVRTYRTLVSPESAHAGSAPEAALQHATEHIHQEIRDVRETQPALNAMATTVAVLYLRQRVAIVGHLGDTRVYLYRDGRLKRLTRDHSLVQNMVHDGLITEAEARVHPKAHVLTCSLGQIGTPLATQQIEVQGNDLFLLCSDGLWACLPEEQLAEDLGRSATIPSAAVQSLLAATLRAGASDNVSIVLVRIAPAPRTTDAEGLLLASQRAKPRVSALKRVLSIAFGLLLMAIALALLSAHVR